MNVKAEDPVTVEMRKAPETARALGSQEPVKEITAVEIAEPTVMMVRKHAVMKTRFTSTVGKKVARFDMANKTWGNVGNKMKDVEKLGVRIYGTNFH